MCVLYVATAVYLCPTLQPFYNWLVLLIKKRLYNEFWSTNTSRVPLFLADVWSFLAIFMIRVPLLRQSFGVSTITRNGTERNA